MTVKEYMESLPKGNFENGQSIADVMAETASIWSNNACEGYVRRAAERIELSKSTTDRLIRELQIAFEEYSVEEAECNV